MSHMFADHMVVFCFGQRGCSILIFRPRGQSLLCFSNCNFSIKLFYSIIEILEAVL